MIQRSEQLIGLCLAETLSFGSFVSSLPVDLPFYKVVELGTLYSSPDHAPMVAELDKAETVSTLVPVLRFIHYLIIHRPNSLGKPLFLIFLIIKYPSKLSSMIGVCNSFSVDNFLITYGCFVAKPDQALHPNS